MCLKSPSPIALTFGREHLLIYNDAFIPLLGDKRLRRTLGRRANECSPEIWHIVGPILESLLQTEMAQWADNLQVDLNRNGRWEENYLSFFCAPIQTESGKVGRVVGERRLRTLPDLAACSGLARDPEDACQIACAILGNNWRDVPFALIYQTEGDHRHARLLAAASIETDTPVSLSRVVLDASTAGIVPWPLAQVAVIGRSVHVEAFTMDRVILQGPSNWICRGPL
jgi:hypothetical protein